MSERGAELRALLEALQAAVPGAMRERAQWLLWRFEKYEGDKKPRKVPYYVSGRKRKGVQGSDADRGELASFDVAMTHLAQGRFDGAGFAFLPGDGLIGIDIDGAIADDGEVSERCQAIIEACGSYTEYSPSGRGVHIICLGQTETFKDNRIGLEVFCGRQFFTVTGRPWSGTPAEVVPIAEKTLKRLQVTVKGARDGAAGASPAPAAGGAAKHVQKYCLAALESAVQRLRGTGEGGRNDALNEEAFGLAQLVASGGLSEATIRAALSDAARSIGLAEGEIKATLNSGVAAGLAQPRAIPEPRGGRKAAGGKSPPGRGYADEGGGGDGGDGGDGGGGDAGPDDEDAGWRAKLLRERGGKKDCRENVYLTLTGHPELKGLVAYDEFAHLVVKRRPPPWDSEAGEWTTNDDYLLCYWLAQHERLTIKAETTLIAGVAMAAFEARFNPLHEYLRGLPEWDGIERLPYWLSECLGADETEYSRLVGAWFLMGMVKRALDPGCQMDYMVVLEGLQGKRKSTALRVLVGRDEWFADTPIRIGDKDAMLSLAGKWLYEIGELDSFNKAEVTAVKQYVSSRIDRVREPFARRPADRRRSGVFAATTNQSEYFKDPTGARRFWPVACDGDIDIDKLGQWRDKLYAEALHRLNSDDADVRRYYPTREETERLLTPQQEKREISDPWFEKLAAWLDSKTNYGESGLEVWEVDNFTAFELLTRCLMVPQDRIDGGRQMATRVGIAMHRLGWEKRRDGGNARVWRYWRPGAKPGPAGGTGDTAGGPARPEPAHDEVLHEF